jgi:L-threonylcarbamoyladenylate synthase
VGRRCPDAAQRLAERLLARPLTLIRDARARERPSDRGQETVALRVPSHSLAQALLPRSAAASPHRPPTATAASPPRPRGTCAASLAAAVDCVLDGGRARSASNRRSSMCPARSPRCCGPARSPRMSSRKRSDARSRPPSDSPRAPGTLAKHYAPQTPLIVMEADLLVELARSMTRRTEEWQCSRARRPASAKDVLWIRAPTPGAMRTTLYANLRTLDDAGCSAILVEQPPLEPAWAAIHDRLTRAAPAPPSPTRRKKKARSTRATGVEGGGGNGGEPWVPLCS